MTFKEEMLELNEQVEYFRDYLGVVEGRTRRLRKLADRGGVGGSGASNVMASKYRNAWRQLRIAVEHIAAAREEFVK